MTMDERHALYKAKEIVDKFRDGNKPIMATYYIDDIYVIQTLLNMIEKRDKDIEYLFNGLNTYEKRFGSLKETDRCRLCGGEHPAVYCKICYDKVTDERDKAEKMVRSYKEREQAILDVLGVGW